MTLADKIKEAKNDEINLVHSLIDKFHRESDELTMKDAIASMVDTDRKTASLIYELMYEIMVTTNY